MMHTTEPAAFFTFSTFETYQVIQDFRGLKAGTKIKFVRESQNVYDSEIIFSFRTVNDPSVLAEVILHTGETIDWYKILNIIS